MRTRRAVLAVVGAIATAATAVLPSRAAPAAPHVLDARRATDEVIAAAALGARDRLPALLRSRRDALLALAATDPAAAAEAMLPDPVIAQVAPLAPALVEHRATVTGAASVTHREDAAGHSSFTTQVATPSGAVTLHAPSLPPVVSGDTVTASGYRLGDALVAYAAGSEASVSVSGTPAATTPLGPLGVAVILADFADSTTSLDPAVARAAFTGSPGQDVASWYAESSYGRSSLNPSVFGPFAIADRTSGGTCANLTTAGNDLLAAASPSVTFSQYRRIMLVFNCTGYGASTSVGETQVATPQGGITGGLTYLDSSFLGDRYGYAHELAHNLGNYHAGLFVCSPDAFVPPTRFGEGCSSAEYGDEFDTLGATVVQPRALPHLDPVHTANAGWFGAGNDVTVATPGTYTYTLAPYEQPSSGVLALTIPRGSSGTAFTLHYRQPAGFDGWMAPSNTTWCGGQCRVTQGPLLELAYRTAGSGGGSDTQLLDTTPGSIPTDTYYPVADARDGALLPGRTFTDPEYGITVSTQSADATGATVTVTIPAAATCVRAAPTVALLSPASQAGPAGPGLTWTARVTSNDSGSCPAERYQYTGGPLQGVNGTGNMVTFTGLATPDHFTLAPGAAADVAVTLTPDPTVTTGAYGFQLSSWGGIGAILANTLSTPAVTLPNVTFQVAAPSDTVAPSPPASVSATALGSASARLSWAPSTDNGAMAGYRLVVDGSSLYLSATNAYRLDGLAPGTSHTVSVQAFDRQGNLSPAATASVALPARTDTTPPLTPSGLTGSATDRSVSLTWLPSDDAGGLVGYRVSPWGLDVPAGTTSVTVPNLPTGTTYQVSVQALDGSGNSSTSSGNGLTVTTAAAGTVAPSRPTGLYSPTAISGVGIAVAWQPSNSPAGVAGYHVYRNGRRWATVTGTSWTDPAAGLYPGSTSYQYAVEAYDGAGNVSPRTPFVQTISPPAGAADTTPPTGASLSSPADGSTVSGSVSLSSSPSDGTGLAKVEFFVDGSFAASSGAVPFAWAWSTAAVSNGPHTLYARATDTAGNYSTATLTTVTVANGPLDTVPPAAVSGLSAAAPAPNQVDLAWAPPADAAGYRVRRDGVEVANVTGTVWSDLGVGASSSHNYTVVAYDAAGNQAPASNTATATTPAAPDTTSPTTPSGLTATPAGTSQVNLAWTASTDNVGVVGYRLYRNGSLVATVAATAWSDTGLAAGTTYSWWVVAYDAAGNTSPASPTVSATTSSAQVAPTGTAAGRVTSRATGAPLASVKVAVSGTKKTWTTDSTGAYSVGGLSPGTYTLTFSLRSYKSQSVSVAVTAGQTTVTNVAL